MNGRPDIMCAVGQLSQFLHTPSSKHLLAAKRMLRYLKGTPTLGITYRPPPMHLTGYSDADWTGYVNTTGYVVMLNNGAIAWKSDKLQWPCQRWSQNISQQNCPSCKAQ